MRVIVDYGLHTCNLQFYNLQLYSLQLPRLVDMGQCNDAYSAIVVASKLAEVFGTDVNGLPLSMDLSWLEQKAVVILCSLLHLGIKNIRWEICRGIWVQWGGTSHAERMSGQLPSKQCKHGMIRCLLAACS